ncbi:MAG: DegT/DnrJ/EryC1/StrS family aminotransferase, partial [bacterium]|nr:DegT/DnrJ/EryC1/StrS family aminotransferase [bacterium]
YSYYLVLFKSEDVLLKVQKALNEQQIFPRRYFYPSLNTIGYLSGVEMPVSENIAPRIMCLPLSHEISEDDLQQICSIINEQIC